MLTVCSAITAIILPNPFAFCNLLLSVVLFGLVCLSKNEGASKRMTVSALWLLILELIALVLLLFQVNVYQPALAWVMYVTFVAVEVIITPHICKKP